MSMKPNMKKFATILLAGALSAGMLAGCGGNSNSSGSQAGSEAATTASSAASTGEASVAGGDEGAATTLRIAWWGNQLRNDTTIAMLDAYTAENSHVTFEPEFSDWSGYWDKMATQAASNNLPDIIQQDYAYIAQYQSKNQLASLTDQINAGNLNVDDVSESILANGTFDGVLYALVSGVNAVCTVYDKTVLDEAGVTVPDRPSYQDVMDIAATVFEKTGVRGEVPGGNGSISMMARSKGEVFFDVANTKLGISDATALEYFTMIKTAIDSPWSVTVDVMQEASTAGVEAGLLPTGKSWNNFPGGSNMVAAMQAATEHELAITMYPQIDSPANENMYLRPAMFWSITESSQNKEASAKVIDFYTNSEKAQDCLKAERGVPVSSKMADYLRPQLDEVQQMIFDYIAKVTEVAVPFDPPQPVGANEVNKLLDDLTDLVRYGEISPEDAAARLIPESNDILAKAAA